MTSIKAIADCIGVHTDGEPLSLVRHLFGYWTRGQQEPLSLAAQVALLQGPHIHLNLIRVGNENFTTSFEKSIDWDVQVMRTSYSGIGIGIGRVQRWFITEAEANELGIFNSTLPMDGVQRALCDRYSTDNDGLDVFVLLQWDPPLFFPNTSVVGRSPVNGPCDKDDTCTSTGSVISLEGGINVLGHEVGHYLGLQHTAGLESSVVDFDNDGVIDSWVPEAWKVMLMFPILPKDAGVLSAFEGLVIKEHCFIRKAC